MGTQPVPGSRAGLYLIIRFTRPFDWVYDQFDLIFTEFRTRMTSFTEFRTRFTEFYDRFLDLPHASLLSPSQIHVSVIISCKTPENGSVENVSQIPR